MKRLIAAAGNLKHQTALALAYATGLRVNEVVTLKVGDIDSQRMTLRVEQGKGQKDRYALLSPVLLERLRVWWRVARAQGKMLDGGWLFPGLNPIEPMSAQGLPPLSSIVGVILESIRFSGSTRFGLVPI